MEAQIQKLFDRAQEVYPEWDIYKEGFIPVDGIQELAKFTGTFEEIYPDTEWVPVDRIAITEGTDPLYLKKLKTIVIGYGFKPGPRVRIYSMVIGGLYFKPNEVMPADTGAYFLPQIIGNRTFVSTRAMLLSFDVDKLVDMKSGTAIVPEGKLIKSVHMDRKTWGMLVREKYFGDIDGMIDEMLDSIYNSDGQPPQSTAELLGKIRIRVHEDDFKLFDTGNPLYYTNKPKEKLENIKK